MSTGRALPRAVLGDGAALAELEALIHPLVRGEQESFLRRARRSGCRLAVLDIPLLFETGDERLVDATCVVVAPRFVQAARVLRRPGMTRAKLADIRARQLSDAEKQRRADHVVRTGLAKGHTRRRVEELARELRRRPVPGRRGAPRSQDAA